jgi:hypothetical protein
MPDCIRWRGLTLERQEGERRFYLLRVTAAFSVAVYAFEGPFEKGWGAKVGLGECSFAVESPEVALDVALKAHLTEWGRRQEEARQLSAFSDFLGLESTCICTNCGRGLTPEDHALHPGKCYACSEGR